LPLLHNYLMDSCRYVRKNTLRAAKGGCILYPISKRCVSEDTLCCQSREIFDLSM